MSWNVDLNKLLEKKPNRIVFYFCVIFIVGYIGVVIFQHCFLSNKGSHNKLSFTVDGLESESNIPDTVNSTESQENISKDNSGVSVNARDINAPVKIDQRKVTTNTFNVSDYHMTSSELDSVFHKIDILISKYNTPLKEFGLVIPQYGSRSVYTQIIVESQKRGYDIVQEETITLSGSDIIRRCSVDYYMGTPTVLVGLFD